MSRAENLRRVPAWKSGPWEPDSNAVDIGHSKLLFLVNIKKIIYYKM
jgi:hypothetical protein